MKKMYEYNFLRSFVWRNVIATLFLFVCFTSVKAQIITADFTSDAVACGSANVNFAATIAGALLPSDCRFDWDFGDGKPVKTGQNVSNGFPVTPGATHLIYPSTVEIPFQVKLTVYRVTTGVQLYTITKPIIIRPAPQPDLIDINNPLKPFDNCAKNPTVQSPFFTVTVGNQSQDINTIDSYQIDWGDGTPVTSPLKTDFPVTHIYGKLGLFRLKFTAIGQNGCSATKTFSVKNQGNPAIGISSGGNTTGCAPITFGFRINRVYLNDPGTVYTWDFGDGTTRAWTSDSINKNDSTVYHTFTRSSCDQTNGYYVVKITATNSCQTTEASVGGVHVGAKPIPSFTAANLCEGEAVVFTNTTLPGMNFDCTKSVVFKWDFGDGSPSVITTSFGDIPHTFPVTSNEYLVKLIAINDCKDSAYFNQKVTLTRRPNADAVLSPLSGCGPITVNAVNKSTGDIKTTLWRVSPTTGWTFGNGTNASSANPQFIFTTKGNYIVTLNVSNNCTFSEKNFNVFVNGKLDVTFPNINTQCNSFTFDASLPAWFKINTIINEMVQANWQITPATGYTFLNGTTTQSLYPQIQFDKEGDYSMTVKLKNGCDSISILKTFRFAKTPVAIATASLTEGCIPFNVHFDNQSTGYLATSVWTVTPAAGATFANGTTATTTSPDIQFSQPGNYTVKLTVTNSCGVVSKSFAIKAKDKPTINFTAIPNTCENNTVIFNSALFTAQTNNGGVLLYDWSITPATGFTYQAGSYSYSANPTIQFTTAGIYQITATVTNDCGSVQKTQTIDVRPTGKLVTAISDTSGCAPKLITFTDNSTGDQLTHQWTVVPNTGFTYSTGSSTSAAPAMLFTKPGMYTITHTIVGLCSTQSKSFTVGISTFPTVNLAPIANQCALPYKLIIDSTNFSINSNGKDLTVIHWEILPETNITYIDGTTKDSKYPHVLINATGQYSVFVEAQNDCGLSTSTQLFRVLEHAKELAVPSATSGCAPLKVTFSDQSKGDLLAHDWTVTPATGWTITPSPGAASPDIVFNKAGIYTVTHSVTNQCGNDFHSYTITVKEVPTAILSPLPNSCNTFTFIADQQNMMVTPNLNDSIHYLWTVTPNRAVTFLNSTSDTSHYPVIQIADTGMFVISVKTFGECGFTEASQPIGITKGPEIMLTPTLTDQCLPSELAFTGTVYGQNLVYNWTVSPMAGATFFGGTNATSPRPQIRFSRPGNYSVSLNVSNNCSNDIKKWDYTIIGKPTILFNAVADTCDNFTFKAERYVVVQDNGNAISNYNWVVTPATGFTFVDGTSATSPLPHINFATANMYKLTMNATNSCGLTSVSQSFTLDQFIQVEAGADTTLCTNNNLYQLKGIPAGGSWSILPVAAAGVLKLVGGSYYLDLNVPGNYALTYRRGNSYCASEDIRKFNIMALPVVDAGRDFAICENEKNPVTLNGVPTGGTWSGTGITGNTFSAVGLANGSYILKYTWSDPVTKCSNTDQLVARLVAVPNTSFTVAVQGCKDQPVLFTPTGVPGTLYNWDFGDGLTATSSGTINHTYRAGGTFTIKMISADPNNCSVASSNKIFIQNDISMPKVTVSPNRGCGPLSVTFTVDTTGTTGNGQSYNWNFGNGQVSNEAFTSKTMVFNQAIGDTIYDVTLTISNNCFTRTAAYPVTVNSLPNANFVMPHAWECSPIIVQFKNMSKDRNATFHWDFGDGTTSNSFQPTHSFSTGKVATEYTIKLVAQNTCGIDSISKPLLIKPNSIEAFIQMNTRQACPGEVVTFTNFSTDTIAKIMNYYWDFGDGSISNTWNATHAYASQGTYTVKLFVDNGCSYAEKTDQIVILPPLTLAISCQDSICLGDNLLVQAQSSLGALINTKWDFGDNYFGTGASNNHTYTTPGWKTISFSASSAASMSHCPGAAIKRVYVKAAPIHPAVSDLEGCAPVRLSLKLPGQTGLLWNFGEDSTWSSSGIYTYYNTGKSTSRRKVRVISENVFGCRVDTSFWVTIYPNPKAKIGLSSRGGYPEEVFVSSLSTNTTACEWLFPDGTTGQGCDSVLIKLYNNGFYKIRLKSSNQYGCSDTTSLVHETIIKGLFVPNAFKPSDPNNQVNKFLPIGIGLKSYYFGIYDTWGNPIWETTRLEDTKPTEGWDGNAVKGKNLPMDVYIWRIKAVFIDGTEWKGMKGRNGILRTEGTVTLIR